jgi:hypothetical protein
MKKIILVLIVIGGFSAASFAQETASATATANIVTPIAISKTTDMNFGNVAVSSSTAGTVILAPAGTRTKSGGVTLPVVPGTVTSAAFTITGQENYTYTISLPSTHTLSLSDNSASMVVNTFTSTPSATGTLTGGTQTVNVGATLNVGAAQKAGQYTNATGFEVTVNYN